MEAINRVKTRKYPTIESLIAAAQTAGSRAITVKGAVKFLRKQMKQNTIPLDKRGYRGGNRSYKAAQDAKNTKRGLRIMEASGLWAQDVAIQYAASLDRRLEKSFESLFKEKWTAWGYRCSQSGWAGGKHSVSVRFADGANVGGHSEKVWSNNEKWSGTNSFATIHITRKAFSYFPDCNIGGNIIVDVSAEHEDGILEVSYVEPSRGFDLKTTTGYFAIVNGERDIYLKLTGAKRAIERTRTAIAA
jgi:hypothetical protein